ncbi:TRAP-type C4-dicarboxylate transport system, small permease component [Pseudovibrio ascidiaceicola]|uniref:TRAP transporter small permease protein n=1 Tax=Pseudovibrio ascidiaceicola TaxID=285279 RepID=A0A1I4EAZ2_9HYPH|nr:TRAP transporter small permease subunit [Pseudovibrio ascidiaceicola]SFL02359.1 TRAP-type C4-dicarboxylate transport system, small permease component [Pseudovibrio ascidiaceicola]
MSELSQHLSPGWSRFVDRLVTIKSWLLAIGCIIMAGTFFLVVIFRYGFGSDLFAYEEWLLIICFWMYFAGAAMGTYDGSHVNADLLTYVIKDPRKAHVRAVIIGAIEFIIAMALVYWSALMIIDEIDSYPRWRATIALRIPFFVPRLAMLVGFATMAFYSLLHLIVLINKGPAKSAVQPSEQQDDNVLLQPVMPETTKTKEPAL